MFCTNCGAQLADGSKFCSSCGAQLSGEVPVANTEVTGMRTVEEVQDFYVNTLKMKEKYAKKYEKGIRKLVGALMPGEVIEFASHAVVGGLNSGTQAEFATTNKRLIIAPTPSGVTSVNMAKRGVNFSDIESYRYNSMNGVTVHKGALIATVQLTFIDGSKIDFGVDKPWADVVAKGLNASMYAHS
ncbi:MAG: zinc ribbon domain-containing protein [Clostridiales bacterium]|nr:zinc ribbon domain-containing protein [Clostridiales bacterium]